MQFIAVSWFFTLLVVVAEGWRRSESLTHREETVTTLRLRRLPWGVVCARISHPFHGCTRKMPTNLSRMQPTLVHSFLAKHAIALSSFLLVL